MLVISLGARANKELCFRERASERGQKERQRKQSGVKQRDERRGDDGSARWPERDEEIESAGKSRERSHVRRAEKRCRERRVAHSNPWEEIVKGPHGRHEFGRQWRING